MKTRWKILLGFCVVAAVVAIAAIARHYQLKMAVARYCAELKAKGEPMDLAQVIPPPVPLEKNAAPLITNALLQIYLETNYTNSIIFKNPPFGMNQEIPGKEMIGWRQTVIHVPGNYYPTNTWNDLSEELVVRKDNLDDFRKLIENPIIDFNYDYSDSKNFIPVLAPHLSQFKIAMQWLATLEFYNLHQNNVTNACADVRTMLAFVKGETDERFEISQLVRFALAQISADATWNILQTTNVSDEELAQLQQDWQSLKFIAPLKNAFLFEQISDLKLTDDIRQSPTNLDNQIGWTASVVMKTENGTYGKNSFIQKIKNEISTKWGNFQWRWFWSYSDEVRGLKMWRIVLDGTQMMETNHSFQSTESFLNANFSTLGFDSVKHNPYFIISQNAHGQLIAIKRSARVETIRNMTVTAIALKRYQILHNQFPATLNELIPNFLESVPIDYMDGKLLRYRKKADGTFLLYSVGENEKDDDGDPSYKPENGVTYSGYSWQNPHALDWVWPQPATGAEIQKYYDERGKKSD